MPLYQSSLDLSGRLLVQLGVLPGSDDRPYQPPGTVYIPYPVVALVDTGASRSQIDIDILRSFDLIEAGRISTFTPSTGLDPAEMPLFLIDLALSGDRPAPLATNLEVIGSDKLAGLRVDMLLGRDVLDRCLLVYDGPGGRFSLAHNPPTEEAI